MMRKYTILVVVVLCFGSIGFATLIDNFDGTITQIRSDGSQLMWLKDASIIGKSGWNTANSWVNSLNDSHYLGYSDWRLPKNLPVNGIEYNYSFNFDGSTDRGENIKAINCEMAYMYHVELGNLSANYPNGTTQPNSGLLHTGPFENLQATSYWSQTPYDPDNWVNAHFLFSNMSGRQTVDYDDVAVYYSWAMRDIDSVPGPIPPIAYISGSYTVYVGDMLTLDASGSTDPDGDIVSCLWDLNDDGVFETDAGIQMIFDVNYSYLESLELLINHTYTIHLKVIDNDGLSGIADVTLTIIPKPAAEVAVDIKPGSCPNPVNTKSSGVLPVAILGSNDLDVTMIDTASIRLAGVEPLRSAYEDVTTPAPDITDCNCIEAGPDGLLDLTLKFATQAIIEAIGDVDDGDIVTLELTGILYDPIPHETPIEGSDCILIKGKYKAHNKADVNKDGVVDGTDFFLIAENWLL